jgi:autotransporter adhesin
MRRFRNLCICFIIFFAVILITHPVFAGEVVYTDIIPGGEFSGYAPGLNALAAGAGTEDSSGALGDYSSAYGYNSASSGTGSTATGAYSGATAHYSTAVGYYASASAENSVALGANSVADQPNTVSVGAPGSERRIVNVAAGVNDTDAVNLLQLNSAVGSGVAEAKRYAALGVAAALAMPSIDMPSQPGKMRLGVELGAYDDAEAVGIGFGYRMNPGMALNLGASVPFGGSGNAAFRGGLTYEW